MKKYLFAIILIAFSVIAWAQDGGKTYNLDDEAGGNAVLSGVDASDTSRWGNGGISADSVAAIVADSLANLTISMNTTTNATSVVVVQGDSLHEQTANLAMIEKDTTITAAEKATIFTSAALTSVPTAPTAAAGTQTTQIATTDFAFDAAQKAAGDTMTARLNAAGVLNTVAKMLIDTVPYFSFGAGHGIPVDTVVMVNFMYGGGFYHAADSFKVTDVRSFLLAGTGTEAATFQVFWGTSMGTAQDSLFTAAVALNSHTGESDVPSRFSAIKPRCYVWGVYRGMVVGHRPTMISSTIMGYIKRD